MAITAKERIERNPLLDVAVLSHGFAPHLRDYDILIEAMWGEKEWGDANGRYLCRFTYCPEAHIVTTVGDDWWLKSWEDTFTDYAKWEDAGSPEGYVWGVCWSLAYPGMRYIESSDLATKWSKRFVMQMHEAELETNAFILRLVFHDFSIEKISDDVGVLDKVLIPLNHKPKLSSG